MSATASWLNLSTSTLTPSKPPSLQHLDKWYFQGIYLIRSASLLLKPLSVLQLHFDAESKPFPRAYMHPPTPPRPIPLSSSIPHSHAGLLHGTHSFCPTQSFHPHGCSLCLEPHSSCSLLSWLLLILQISAHTSLLRKSLLIYPTQHPAPSPFPPVTSVTPPCLFPHCTYCALTLFIHLFTCVYGFHLRKM